MNEFTLEKKSVATGYGDIVYFSHCPFPDRPTVLLLHGLSSNHITWIETMKKLAGEKINSISPDLRGHGFSDKSRKRSLYRLEEMKFDLESIRKQEGIDTIHIVGYSWGGYIGIDYTTTHPENVSSLSLISTGYTNPFVYSSFPFIAQFGFGLLTCLAFLLKPQYRKEYHYFKPGESKGYWHSTFTGLASMPLSVNFWMLAQVLRVDFRKTIHSIVCPTLLVYGERDAFISIREIMDMSQKIKNCKTVKISASSHYLGTYSQDIISDHIIAFIHQLPI